jgi:hypothetical protein
VDPALCASKATLTCTFQDLERVAPEALLNMAQSMHGILFHLHQCGLEGIDLQTKIASICEQVPFYTNICLPCPFDSVLTADPFSVVDCRATGC